ncbi:hypothetical protein [Paenibacillus peoriae]|uniref:hypothetical protein n=1 Tax=Paenibacillus peoriae TaxID=59893 RepID=UPI00096D4F3B|nr:hypothetical protein [Paenibacillus peoriae]OME69655.1 hypothetical protein BK119_14405 [Paenibacillus peoriae]
MEKLGLDVESLFLLGTGEQAAASGEFVLEVFEDKEIMNNLKYLQPAITVAREEAIIKAVAVMIEENNNELLKQLKAAGVLPDQ